MSDELYALFHVNRITGEARRYPREAFPAMTRAQAEEFALGSRQAAALTQRERSEWETRALPDKEVKSGN